jgi:hypothetical protein
MGAAMLDRHSGRSRPPCPACGRSARVAPVAAPGGGRLDPPSRAAIRREAERAAARQLGPRPDTHPFNYAVAALGMIFVCVAIPGTAWDFARAGLCEIALLGLASVVNATVLRESASAIERYDRRRQALVERASAALAARHAASWRCSGCDRVFAPPSPATGPLEAAESFFLASETRAGR